MTNQFSNTFSRRRFLMSAGIGATASVVPRGLLGAGGNLVDNLRAGGAHAKINVQSLRGNISALIGSGGNIVVLPGADGKLLIDADLALSRPQISQALDSLSSDPIRHLVNTHWHFDHTDGNQWLHASGATILAHENSRKRLSIDTRVEGWKYTFPASPPDALPSIVFQAGHTLRANGETIALKHYAPAHTDSDMSVHFTNADVFHTGDTCWNGLYPFVDYSTGGSIDGMIRATDENLAKVSSQTIIVPGHGPIGDKSQLTEYRDVLVTVREKVAALKKQGLTLDEIVATKPGAAYDAKYGKFLMTPAVFTGLVYAGV
jgi:glyoxylase-like metal-dependent hydrolase (beta-lactamase superfamily II)